LLLDWRDVLAALAPLPVAVAANLGERQRWARVVTLTVMGGAVAFFAFAGIYGVGAAAFGQARGVPAAILLIASALAAPVLTAVGRRWYGRLLPLDPDSLPTALALVGVILLVALQLSYQLSTDVLATVAKSAQVQPLDVVGQEIPLLLLALAGAGLLTRRNLPATLVRLGIVRPTWWQLVLGLATAGLFLAVQQGTDALQQAIAPDVAQRLNQATGHYYAALAGPVGIGVIALAPGIAEESFFRGALQPRLGLIVATIAFAAVHTQYALTIDTLLVFVLGLVLGLLRRRFNTTTSMTTHATYNGLSGAGLTALLLPWAFGLEVILVAALIVAFLVERRRSALAGTP